MVALCLGWGWGRQEGLRRNLIGGSTLHTFKLELGHGDSKKTLLFGSQGCSGQLNRTDVIRGSRSLTPFSGLSIP